MVDFPVFDEIPGWFVVLPDRAAAAPVGAALRDRAVQEVSHPSGRPWLLGRWSPDSMAVGEAGPVRIAVIGEHAVTAGRLTTAAGRTSTVADLDGLAGSMTGSFHLAASVAGDVRIQGTLTGLRPVFHADVGDVSVASDRADVLAGLLDAGVDRRRLALHLLDSFALYPLAGEPVWRGVDVLSTGRYLVLGRDGRRRTVTWWTPPEPVVPMAEGAPALREALSAAVEVRVRGRDLVSCDLGGLDSTSVCSLAARGGAGVVAYTADGRDPVGDDVTWARRTVAGLGNVEHHIIPGDRMPMVYEGLRDTRDRFDEPCPAAVDSSRWLVVPRLAAARGSRRHLTGFGGDELLAGSPAHLHALLRTHPRTALQRVRGFAAQRPWSHREALRQLWDRSPYRAWLARVAGQLTAVPPPMDTPTLDWGSPPRMPPWATPHAVDAVRELIRTAAPTAEPLAEGRGQHVELEAMRSTSRMVRQLGQMAAGLGITLSAPYYDDRVIEAGLAVRPQDRITPWQYKPLIVEAMRGVVPDESLTRHTKDEGSYEVEAGLREHRAELLALCEESRLARLDLVDPDALREVCSRPLPPTLQFDALFQTVACEVWLRTLETATVAG
ncbi:lasso peptide isopeptide bond-forming cyclase [Streptomyces ficellus]|uniref:Lasso peptide isopeptide bond-forming cyclase n=1 Tax=Streptomyces ficellus TaxID=1977088 RepID=A0ABT7Z874_9ACTN|nr:lasso peptide isopeptide bond-forming cyclase [Streptomyces ficellus]MDN3295286.1 lasso peptide isopeptide bond-forming cyclase [Streptomyces ficellus]